MKNSQHQILFNTARFLVSKCSSTNKLFAMTSLAWISLKIWVQINFGTYGIKKIFILKIVVLFGMKGINRIFLKIELLAGSFGTHTMLWLLLECKWLLKNNLDFFIKVKPRYNLNASSTTICIWIVISKKKKKIHYTCRYIRNLSKMDAFV